MKIKGKEFKNLIETNMIAYKCPYCSKKFFNKGSYRNHILKGYCYFDERQFKMSYEEYKKLIVKAIEEKNNCAYDDYWD